jgi:hypothetical protein
MSETGWLPPDARAAHYRQQASNLRTMAETESNGRLRAHMLRIAGEYDKLAAGVLVASASRQSDKPLTSAPDDAGHEGPATIPPNPR